MRTETIVMVGLDHYRDTESDRSELHAAEMLNRWHGPTGSGEVRLSNGKIDKHPGRKALNTLLDSSMITPAMLANLAEFVDELEQWALDEVAWWTPHVETVSDDGPAYMNARTAIRVIIEARQDCLKDIDEFREAFLTRALAATHPDPCDMVTTRG